MIRLGVIGYGLRMQGVYKSLREMDCGAEVVAIVDRDVVAAKSRLTKEDQERVVFYDSLSDMVKRGKIDGLLIGTRCDTHTPYAIEASQYDIPIFLEKPVAVSMRQALDLERAFKKSRCEVVVSFPLVVSQMCRLAKQKIDSGAIGSCEHICATNYVHYGIVYWQQEYRNYDITRGLLLQKATHDFNYMSYLMGSPIVKVAAMATKGRVFGGNKPAGLRCSQCDEQDTCAESPVNRRRNCSTELLDDHLCLFSVDCGSIETGTNEDSSSVLLKFASGAHGVYTQVFFTRRDAKSRGSIISGYDGTINFDWQKNEFRVFRHHEPFTDTISVDSEDLHFGGDYELLRNFINVIKGKEKSNTTIWDGLQSVYCCLAAMESVDNDCFVDVRQVESGSSRQVSGVRDIIDHRPIEKESVLCDSKKVLR